MESLSDIVTYVNRTLDIGRFNDYCPNGLQVQGRQQVGTLVTGVTASEAFLRSAIEAGADAVLVHHGYFWRGEPAVVTGMKRRRLGLLIEQDVSLLAYHLPLDTHATLGNNACLTARLGVRADSAGSVAVDGIDGLLWHGELEQALPADRWIEAVGQALGRVPVVVGDRDRSIRRVAWCSGGAQRMLLDAAALGVDAFVSGEISEQTTHEARESGVLYLGAGHHATERYGVQALGEHLAAHFAIAHRFIEIDNPA